MSAYIRWFSTLGMQDIDQVGGKNASLGEMVSNLVNLGVSVPDGFATTAAAYRNFLVESNLETEINELLENLDVEDTRALSAAGEKIRTAIKTKPFGAKFEAEIKSAYEQLVAQSGLEASFAVRSSATAEDLPDASFAGQQETFLNVSGLENILGAIKEVFASLYNDRAIAYRVHHGFDHSQVALSAGIQKMVRSDLAASGVMFTMDTESGFSEAVFITSSYGLGEAVVQGAVNPDEFYVYKPALRNSKHAVLSRTLGSKASKMVYAKSAGKSLQTVESVSVEQSARARFSLTDEQVEELARQALIIEEHYQRPMDIEWGLDGLEGKLYILQARPETVQSRRGNTLKRFRLEQRGEVLTEGQAIGQKIGAGKVRVLNSLEQMHDFKAGEILVADMTDPDWEPIMKRAGAIVTNRGGRTCHAAIIARELGIPAVVGTSNATEVLKNDQSATVSCAEGDAGFVYAGQLDFKVLETELDAMPEIKTKIMMNVGTPEQAFAFSQLPHHGVGLARLEFIINRQIGIHPKALLDYELLKVGSPEDQELAAEIEALTSAYESPRDFFISRVVEGVSTIAAAFAPHDVIVRISDFKSNEYANLLGGYKYEPNEENPMIGYRGASRYLSEDFAGCFEMETAALKFVREEMGLENVKLMIPFVRTLSEAKGVIELLAQHGLKRGENGLAVMMMCEVPSNAVLADEFLNYFDGFSIGSNDLTQLTLGLDRDSALVANSFDERDPAVRLMLAKAIEACNKAGKYVGICGQGPSDHPDLADWLVEQGIQSISLNPDTVVETWLRLAD